ncbi:hypothetical protein SHIRM173S_06617 [Streptomyces hirsutus]
MRGHQAYGVGAHGATGEGVRGDVLGVDLLQEVQGAAASGAFLRTGGGGEQGAHRVEVPVGVAAGRTAAVGGAFQSRGPRGAVPQVPQRLLRGAAARQAFTCRAQQRAEPLGSARVGGVVHDQPLGFGQGPREEFVRGRWQHVARGPLLLAQGPAETAQVRGVHAGEGGGEQGERGLGVEPAGLLRPRLLCLSLFPPLFLPRSLLPLPLLLPRSLRILLRPVGRLRRRHRSQGREQRGHRRFVAQGKVVAVDVHRDARRGEGPADGGKGAGAGPHQDGHVVPGDAVLQVGPAQDVGDVVQLRAGGRIRVDLGPAAVPHRGELPVGADLLGGQPGQRHALGDQTGGGQQGRAGAARDAQHLDRGRTAVRAGENVGEVQDAVHVRAPEGVDRLVRVAEGDQGAAAAGQRLQQPHLRRVGVLVLVHVDGVVARGELPGGLGAAGEEHRAVDQFGVVEDALQVEDVEVLGEEGGRRTPVGASDAAGEGVQGVGAEAQLAAAGEHRADLVGEAAGGQAGAQFVRPAHMRQAEALQVDLTCEQLPDSDVLLGARQQPQRLDEEVAVLVGADQGVAQRVERGRLGRVRGPRAQSHAVAQLDRRPAAERQHEDASGITSAGDPRGHRLDQCGRLPGARTCEDEHRSGPVVNHGALCGVKPRGDVRAGGVRTSR